MGLIKSGTMVIGGLILVLILGQVISSINTDLRATFDSNPVFGLTGPLTLILLALLAVGFVVGIILHVLKEREPEEVPMRSMSRFKDFDE